jgi:ATP-dependent Clp protease adapter protein ClpS
MPLRRGDVIANDRGAGWERHDELEITNYGANMGRDIHRLVVLHDRGFRDHFSIGIHRHFESRAGLSTLQAVGIMLAVHKKGRILLPMQSSEQSQRTAESIAAEARAKNHPLVCRAVSIE